MRRLLVGLVVVVLVLCGAIWWTGRLPMPLHPVAGPQHQTDAVLDSYNDPKRDQWQQTDRVIATMGLNDGQSIADVGAGSGYFTYHFSRVVGPNGKVYALDVDPQAIAYLQRRLQEEKPPQANIEIVKSRTDSITLPKGSLDWAFLCEAHFFLESDPGSAACVRSMAAALKPGGRLAVIEVAEDPRRGVVDRKRLEAPFLQAGLKVAGTYDFLGREHFVIFSR